jgi:perosamine synthetase
VEACLTPRTKAVVAVGLYGSMPRWRELQALTARHGLWLIEDAAESLGSMYHGVRSGAFGVGSVFSFHRTKTLTTGEGGMLLLDDEDLYERCLMLRDHGRKRGGPTFCFWEVTHKYMPFNVQAALGYAQFQRLGELLAKKRALYDRYRMQLADIDDLHLNHEPPGVINSVWMTTAVFGRRHRVTGASIADALSQFGIPTRPFFRPLTSMPAYAAFRERGARNRCAYDISARGLNLPSALRLTTAQVDEVSDALRALLGYPPRHLEPASSIEVTSLA